ncbi:MAG: radical SAM protein [Desulfobulbus sp.]
MSIGKERMEIAAQRLYKTGELQARALDAQARLARCTLCPRACRVDRLAGETGFCGVGALAHVASYGPHFGEEAPLSGTDGSGTIFFSGCNLGCCFCQNWEISWDGDSGREVDATDLAGIMLELQNRGCHNINLVTPSHVVPQILAALVVAVEAGLRLPVVFNCGGYESSATLTQLAGVVDIYLADIKFWRSATAKRYAQAPGYPGRARASLVRMHRQVGTLVLDDRRLARSGLMIRHLLMPGLAEETAGILNFIAAALPRDTFVNLMPQYRPCGRADDFPELREAISGDDYRKALTLAESLGLTRLDLPDLGRLLRLPTK